MTLNAILEGYNVTLDEDESSFGTGSGTGSGIGDGNGFGNGRGTLYGEPPTVYLLTLKESHP